MFPLLAGGQSGVTKPWSSVLFYRTSFLLVGRNQPAPFSVSSSRQSSCIPRIKSLSVAASRVGDFYLSAARFLLFIRSFTIPPCKLHVICIRAKAPILQEPFGLIVSFP